MRVVMWHPRGCPVCASMNGSALHILEEHCAPRLPAEYTKGALGALVLLQTSRPAKELRRNIRLVGQTLRGGGEWGWLQTQKPETAEERGAAEDERLAATIEDLVEEAREAVGHDWEADLE